MNALPLSDTVRMPWQSPRRRTERVVPPALAVLFRVAVGPGADRFVPRFLRFEKAGASRLGWYWPAFWLPSAWAFYRRLWLAGLVYAFLPIVGAALFFIIEPDLSQSLLLQTACATALVWLFPGVVSALLADALLYARMQRLLRAARKAGPDIVGIAKKLSSGPARTSPLALVLGFTALAPIVVLVVPHLQEIRQGSGIRAQVADTLAAVKPVQQRIEDEWERERTLPRTIDAASALMARGGQFLDSVNFNPLTGRMRLALGSHFAALSGKSILLAPTVDAWQQLHWVCIPIDIAEKYLPLECRRR